MNLLRLAVSLFLAGAAIAAHALDVKPYSANALAEAQRTGAPVALHFRADWCPTCRAQDKVLESLRAEPGLGLTVLAVDYDNEKSLKSRFRITSQSTLVVLKGQKETARLVGDTSKPNIIAALKSAY